MERALLCTHHLLGWTGSEVVVIEMAEALAREGFAVDVYAPFHDRAFAPASLPPHGAFLTAPRDVRLGGYDLVHVQHQTLSRVLPHQDDDVLFGPRRPWFHFAHLSSVEPFELPGPWVEEDIADSIWTQSPATLARYRRRYPGRIAALAECVPNPAPAAFERPAAPGRPGGLRRLLSVSNHLPPELAAAFGLLEAAGVEVIRFGHPGGNLRLTPADLHQADAVVTIGKTVQYALLARCPVFVYDHHGGPGWLTAANLRQTAHRNFSGLNAPGRADGAELEARIRGGFAAAAAFAASLREPVLAPYRLEPHVARLVARVRAHASAPRPLAVAERPGHDRAATRARWAREAALYRLVDREYGQARTAVARLAEHERKAAAPRAPQARSGA